MIFPSVDIYTIQLMIAITHFVFLVVLFQLSNKNKDIQGINWWLYASLLLTIDTSTTLFPGFRTSPSISILLNFMGILAYIFLMIGCFQFSNSKLNRLIPYGLGCLYIIFNLIDFIFSLGVMNRIYFIGSLISITLVLSIKAILKLDNKFFIVEKYLLVFLLIVHIFIYCSWTFIDLGLQYREHSYFAISLVSIYVIDAMIFIIIFLLVLSKRRQQLNEENEKYSNTQKEIATAISNANIASKAKTIFLSSLSYELRTPLNTILNYTEILTDIRTGELNEKQQGFIDYIKTAANNLLTLLTSLIDLSNIETRKIDLNIRTVDANKYIDNLLPVLQKEADNNERKLNIKKINDKDKTAYIKIDETALRTILLSLLANAIEYSSKDSTITLEYGAISPDIFHFAIIDKGVGIDIKFENDVFKPFIKPIDGNYYIGSTGTGLAIAKGLMDLMYGDIKYNSKIGEGAKFWIEFPMENF